MSFEADFLTLMPHSVTRNAYTKRDAYGKPSYSTMASIYQARVVAKPMSVWTPNGLELVATNMMYLATTEAINQQDQITYAGSTHKIVEIGVEPDADGVHHTWLKTKGA